MFDVTLATDDGQHIKAHKMILSAGSDFFSDIFMKSNHKNILIYLKGISSTELEHVADFMYDGEVFITQEELKQFLETAQELKVKGLQGEIQGIGQNRSGERKPYSGSNVDETECQTNENVAGQESILDSLEELADSFHSENDYSVVLNEHNIPLTTNQELDLQIEQMVEKKEGKWNCKVCGKTAAKRHHIQSHAETHIEGLSHACNFCSKTFPRRQNLRMHIYNIHSELFSCNSCSKFGMNRLSYREHKNKYHKTLSVKQ
jgi:hypothetical protein